VPPAVSAQLYLIEDVCSATGLGESAVRLYSSLYADVLPSKVYRGEQALYTDEAVRLIRTIDELRREGITSPAEVAGHLRHVRQEEQSVYKSEAYGKIVVVTSGKGGVGKSNLALNMAIAFSMKGYRTALIDADLGLANIHILCGHQPRHTLLDMVKTGLPMTEIIERGPGSVDLIVGGSGTDELANLPRHERYRLISELETLEKTHEVVVIDTSPGISRNVTDFIHIADRVVLLTTPDLTSTTDAYGLLKTVFGSFPGADIGIVCNMTRARQQAEVVFTRLDVCARRFLNATIRNLGHIPRDPAVGRANTIQRPYLLIEPDSRAAQHTLKLADRALEKEPGKTEKKTPSFRELFRKKDPFLEQALDHKEVRYITR